MKKFFILLLTCLSTYWSHAQSITGLVKSDLNEAVPFANVLLYVAKDSTLAKAELCTENGGFSFGSIKAGRYFLSVSSVGFEKYSSVIFEVADQKVELQPIVLKSQAALKEVQVKAQKPLVEVQADKTVFNVQSSLSATGTTSLELLRKAPGVRLDNNENLIVEGKTGVRVFIDGKASVLTGQDLTEYLKTLQASDIEAIEIITQPSARYDAAGNAGIINIRLKKDKRFGTNGSLSLGYAYGRYGKFNSGLSLNHRNRKVNIFGTLSNRVSENWAFLNFYRQQVNSVFDQKSRTVSDGLSNNAKVGLDFFATKKSTFGLMLNANFNDNSGANLSRTLITPPKSTLPSEVLIADNRSQSSSQNLYLNTNYKFADTLGHSLNVDFDLGYYGGQRESFQPNVYKDIAETQTLLSRTYRMKTPTDIRIVSLKAEYDQKLGRGTLSLGFKVSNVKTDNTFNFFDVIDGSDVFSTGRSNNFVYNEQINAGYANYGLSWKKINLQAGLRVEQTLSDGQLNSTQANQDARVKRNYTNLFPSGGITYSPNQHNSLALTYSRRIERPTYQALNPFEWQLDELTYQKGNAFLQPQYTNNLKLSHTYKYTLTTSLSYSYIRDVFAQITDTTGFNRNFLMEQNIANQRIINLGLTYSVGLAKWWNVFVSVEGYHTDYRSNNPKFKPVQATVLSLYGQNTFSLPRKWSLEVSGWYSSPGIWGGTYVTRSQGSLDLGLQKRLFKEKIAFRLALSDVLFTSPWRGTTQFGGLRIVGSGGWESRQVRVSLGYGFGNKQVKSARQRSTGLEDESRRIQ